jgi:hypothetical protein
MLIFGNNAAAASRAVVQGMQGTARLLTPPVLPLPAFSNESREPQSCCSRSCRPTCTRPLQASAGPSAATLQSLAAWECASSSRSCSTSQASSCQGWWWPHACRCAPCLPAGVPGHLQLQPACPPSMPAQPAALLLLAWLFDTAEACTQGLPLARTSRPAAHFPLAGPTPVVGACQLACRIKLSSLAGDALAVLQQPSHQVVDCCERSKLGECSTLGALVAAAHHPGVHRHHGRRAQDGERKPAEVCRHWAGGAGRSQHGKRARPVVAP